MTDSAKTTEQWCPCGGPPCQTPAGHGCGLREVEPLPPEQKTTAPKGLILDKFTGLQCDDGYDDDEDGDCPNCGGEGGYASCVEDWCPYVGGEEDCDDPACWRRCGWCNGKG